MPPMNSGRLQIVAPVNCMMKSTVAVTFDFGNMLLLYKV